MARSNATIRSRGLKGVFCNLAERLAAGPGAGGCCLLSAFFLGLPGCVFAISAYDFQVVKGWRKYNSITCYIQHQKIAASLVNKLTIDHDWKQQHLQEKINGYQKGGR